MKYLNSWVSNFQLCYAVALLILSSGKIIGVKPLCVFVERLHINFYMLLIMLFSEAHRKKSERVLVFSEHGRSRAGTAVMAYLIKKNKWTLKVLTREYNSFLLQDLPSGRRLQKGIIGPRRDGRLLWKIFNPQEAYDHVKRCHHHMQPLQAFLEQLSKLEQNVHGKSVTPIAAL